MQPESLWLCRWYSASAKLLAPPFIKLAYAGIAKSPPEEEEAFRIG